MSNELILKKLEQIKKLLNELESLLFESVDNFEKNTTNVRAAERNFQLIVDLASDINTQILIEKGEKTPDSYRQSFTALGNTGVIEDKLAKDLSISASLRNILVHEYDFDEDFKKFYVSAKSFIEPYKKYLKEVYDYTSK